MTQGQDHENPAVGQSDFRLALEFLHFLLIEFSAERRA
jgi:hypothetical protein